MDRGAVGLLTRTGSTERISIQRSPRRCRRSARARPISTGNCAAAWDVGNAAALVFFIFDLLHLDGDDVGARPLMHR
jgi:hypothetical protein